MDAFLIKALQLILALALLIIIHEFGHFFFARLFGVRVEKFYIFFDPWFSLFKWRPKKREGKSNFWRDTEYGIGWIPLGGYCKISGMIDESMDTEQMKQPPQPWEFRSKPAWQRLLIMIAGVLFNFLLAIIIYAGIVYATGEKYVKYSDAQMGMVYSGAAHRAGFRDGDIPLRADGVEVASPEQLMDIVQASNVEVRRADGSTASFALPRDFVFQVQKEAESDTAAFIFMTYRIPTQITQVMAGEGAAKAGIEAGDRIIAIDSLATPSLDRFLSTLRGHDNGTVNITLLRPKAALTDAKTEEKADYAQADTLVLPVKLSESSKMGVGLEVNPAAFFPYTEKRYNLLQSVPRGIEMGTDKLTSYAKSMKLVFTKEGAKSVGGFGALGSIFPEKWDWIAFWNIAAFISVALAFMNILPIPALDGGHVMFLLYEVIFRRKPNEKFMEVAQMVGMGLLILLLLYANGMDIVRLFK